LAASFHTQRHSNRHVEPPELRETVIAVSQFASVLAVRPFSAADMGWVEALLDELLGGRWQARLGEILDVLSFEGLVAEDEGEGVGFVGYRRHGRECELMAIAAARRHTGVGTALLAALRREVSQVERIWLVTTNDNLEALRFYQRRGFRLCRLRAGGVDDARQRLKPGIPLTGALGIPMHDELELELVLDD
jgi:GNAT superfamily N-acetyltransferase